MVTFLGGSCRPGARKEGERVFEDLCRQDEETLDVKLIVGSEIWVVKHGVVVNRTEDYAIYLERRSRTLSPGICTSPNQDREDKENGLLIYSE